MQETPVVGRDVVLLRCPELGQEGDLSLDLRDIIIGRIEFDYFEGYDLCSRVVHADIRGENKRDASAYSFGDAHGRRPITSGKQHRMLLFQHILSS